MPTLAQAATCRSGGGWPPKIGATPGPTESDSATRAAPRLVARACATPDARCGRRAVPKKRTAESCDGIRPGAERAGAARARPAPPRARHPARAARLRGGARRRGEAAARRPGAAESRDDPRPAAVTRGAPRRRARRRRRPTCRGERPGRERPRPPAPQAAAPGENGAGSRYASRSRRGIYPRAAPPYKRRRREGAAARTMRGPRRARSLQQSRAVCVRDARPQGRETAAHARARRNRFEDVERRGLGALRHSCIVP